MLAAISKASLALEQGCMFTRILVSAFFLPAAFYGLLASQLYEVRIFCMMIIGSLLFMWERFLY
jgi:hypothetical protein